MTTKDVTVYIGRFNPFHSGHAHVLEQALKTSKLVIVLIGSAGQARSLKNPFKFEERRDMIERWQMDAGVGFEFSAVNGKTGAGRTNLVILPIRDYPYNNALWIRAVQRKVKDATTKFARERGTILTNVFITGSDRDDSTWYLQSFPQWKQDLVEPFLVADDKNISATDVRRWMWDGAAGETELSHIPTSLPQTTMDYLGWFMETEPHEQLKREYNFVTQYKKSWDVAPYPVIFQTVDAVVVQSGHVLAVKRGAEPGKGLWALPGGFLNQNERLRDGAIRELVEETGIRLAEGKKSKELTEAILRGSIHEYDTFDAPDRSSRGRTITTAFLFRLDDTRPLPKVKGLDDAVDAFWIPISDALDNTAAWFEDHHSILETLIGGKDY